MVHCAPGFSKGRNNTTAHRFVLIARLNPDPWFKTVRIPKSPQGICRLDKTPLKFRKVVFRLDGHSARC